LDSIADFGHECFLGLSGCKDESIQHHRAVTRAFVSSENINKCPLQARMLPEVKTEFVFILDGDQALSIHQYGAFIRAIGNASNNVALFGRRSRATKIQSPVLDTLKKHCPPPYPEAWDAIILNKCVARTAALRDIGWPPAWLVMLHEQFVMYELLRRKGWNTQAVHFLTGLGDVVSIATSAVGVKPCGGCKQRQEKLNQIFPFNRESVIVQP
jgi:hypothetical protein